MPRYTAEIERTQVLEVEFEAPDGATEDDLGDLAMAASDGEWYEADTIATYVGKATRLAEDHA